MFVTGQSVSPEEFASEEGVSRETLARLEIYVEMLVDWNRLHNLVSEASLADVWRRHVWDSAQLARYIPARARTLVDLGSGAGFPGLVLAELLRGRTKATLIESVGKKCQFLRAVAVKLGLDCDICHSRIESFTTAPYDVITARACAPLSKLLGYAQHFTGPETVTLFLKGQNLGVELTDARKSWKIRYVEHPSRTDPSGSVLEIREFRHG